MLHLRIPTHVSPDSLLIFDLKSTNQRQRFIFQHIIAYLLSLHYNEVMAWIEFIWLRIRAGGGSLWAL